MLWGADIGAKFIILHNGREAFKVSNPEEVKGIIGPNDVIVLEQTGAYGVRWAEIFTTLGAKVFIADGRDFKNFRLAYSRKKDDKLDALYLRKYFKEKPKKCRQYNPLQIKVRALIRQHIRNQKDITKHTNRLRQYLAVIFPFEDFYNWSRQKLFKNLETIKSELVNSPHALNGLALAELQKLEMALKTAKVLEEEVITIAKNHPDYEILKTFPIGDIQIATLLAYSWDISNFEDKDGYIAYVLMGANLEQSGVSVWKVKTDKARTEIKGIFYLLFMQAHRKNTKKGVLYPLLELVKDLVNTSYNYKKRYIKFLSRFLELTFYARKNRLTFEEVIKLKIARLESEKARLQGREKLSKNQAYKLFRITRSLEAYKEMLNMVQRQDIPETPTIGAGRLSYLDQKKEEDSNDRRGVYQPIVGEVKGKIPQSGDIKADNRTSDKRRDRATKGGGSRKTSKGKVSELRDLHLGKEGVQQWKGEGNDPPT